MSSSAISPRIAVVTGANKGIGFEIVKKICRAFDGVVYLTSRDEERGRNAIAKLQQEGVTNLPKWHQLDIADEVSIERLRAHIAKTHSGLDVLVNNAGMAYKSKSTVPFHEQAESTVRVNFTGTLNVCKALFPLLRTHGRVVHVSSQAGLLKRVTSQSLRDKLVSNEIQESELVALMQDFVEATKRGDHETKGWPSWAYAMSKLGINILTGIQAREIPYDKAKDILINCCCPGYCKTDMAPNGHRPAEEGAETPAYLALLPPGVDHPHGKFYYTMNEISWKEL